MKILYLKGCKWLLSQNQHVRSDFFGYRRYEALAKHIKPFFQTSNIKVNGRQCPDYICQRFDDDLVMSVYFSNSSETSEIKFS